MTDSVSITPLLAFRKANRMTRSVLPRRAILAALGLSLAASTALAACGGGSSSKAAASASPTTSAGAPSGGTSTGAPAAGSGYGSFPGASGSVAAISGSSMEVQNPESGQVTVSWTGSTTFGRTATVTASSVAAGDCVTVSGTSSKGVVAAKTVVISQPIDGTCARAAFGGRAGGVAARPGGPGGSAGPPPGGSSRSGSRTGRFHRFGGASGFSFASGKVTSLSSTGLVLSGFSSARISKKPATGTTTKPTFTTATVHVTLASSTVYTEQVKATPSDLAVGDCVTATGKTSSTGAVTASRIQIDSTGDKTCTTGFGGFGGGGAGAGTGAGA
jgi:hypothetical protein